MPGSPSHYPASIGLSCGAAVLSSGSLVFLRAASNLMTGYSVVYHLR